MGKKVVVVEDDPDIASIVETYLTSAGFTVTVAADGAAGLEAAESHDVELVVLDWMLPDTDGPSFIRRLRARRRTPVIMLTARTEEDDRLRGFRAGADDYVAKPFSPRELVARVKAVLSRSSAEVPGVRPLRFGRLSIEPQERSITVAGRPVEFTTREFDLLYLLARHPLRVFGRDELLDRIWGDERGEVDRVVDVHISNIRAKIEEDSSAPRYIVTLRGVGYKFAATEDETNGDER
ncbi:MAG: DNA-binding response regulator [Spirochaetaceae bacterium]|nr:MAG: DNA-binding response regulator [Spirochaetaceae bacterium]